MNRMKILSSWLKKEDIQGAFIHTKENVFYLSGYFTEPHERVMGLFVFQEAEPFFILPKMEVEQAKMQDGPAISLDMKIMRIHLISFNQR